MPVNPISTYPALLAEIADWADRASLNDATNNDVIISRPDLGPVASSLVVMCEAQIRRNLETRRSTTTVVVSLDTDSGFDLPDDFGGLDALTCEPFADGRYFPNLIAVSANQLAEQQRVQTYGYLGQPRYYAIVGDRIQFAPVQSPTNPDTPAQLTLTYRRVLPPLTLMNPSNWMLRNNPDVYLYGSLAAAALYLKDYDQIGPMQGAFSAAIENVVDEGIRQARPAVLRPKIGMLV